MASRQHQKAATIASASRVPAAFCTRVLQIVLFAHRRIVAALLPARAYTRCARTCRCLPPYPQRGLRSRHRSAAGASSRVVQRLAPAIFCGALSCAAATLHPARHLCTARLVLRICCARDKHCVMVWRDRRSRFTHISSCFFLRASVYQTSAACAFGRRVLCAASFTRAFIVYPRSPRYRGQAGASGCSTCGIVQYRRRIHQWACGGQGHRSQQP